MSYFAPYIDGTGLHMPTYEERLEDLVSAYQSIFGIDAELSESVPDYLLLSVFAKALDDIVAKLQQGASQMDNQNGTVTVNDAGTQPAPVKALFPITAGVRTT